MFTRAEFTNRVASARRTAERDSRLLALAAVPLGLGQLLLIRWADKNLAQAQALRVEGSVFLLYMGLVVWLLLRLVRHAKANRIACPSCGVPLGPMSERVAMATGRCDSCGGEVVEAG